MRIELEYNEFADLQKQVESANKKINQLESEIKDLKKENFDLKEKLQEIISLEFFERVFYWKKNTKL